MSDALKIPIVEQLSQEIMEKRTAELSKKINLYPRNQPIMSDIGDCNRQIVYGVLDWDKKTLHDADLQARFEIGNLLEREIIRELMALGYDVVLSQQAVEIKHKDGSLLARGKVDGFFKVERQNIPFEIKSMNPSVYEQVESVEDFNKKPWLRKYIRQLQLYMYGNSIEYSLFIITDCLGHWKILPLYLDYGDCEHLLQRLESIHENIKKKEYPERIPYNENVCGYCPFAHICLPDVMRSEAQILSDESLIADLEEREGLKKIKTRFEELDKSVKNRLKGIEKGLAGNYAIVGKMQHRNGFTVEPNDYWKVDIKKLD